MQCGRLGKTDIKISKLSFGTWALAGGSHWGDQDNADAVAAIETALDLGMTFLDTAEAYGGGKSESLIGQALGGGKRDKAVIGSKVGPKNFAPDDLRHSCESSLKRLRTDYLDLYMLHWPSREIPLEDTMETMRNLQDEGKIRAIGVSNFGPEDLRAALATGIEIVTNQLAYNLVFRAIEYEILPLCREKGIGVLAYSTLMQGVLTGKWESSEAIPDDRARTRIYASDRHPHAKHGEYGAEEEIFDFLGVLENVAEALNLSMAHVALAWIMNREGVDAAIVGGRNPDQVRRNVEAGDIILPEDAQIRLAEAGKKVKEKLGPNADMWQVPSRIR